MSHRFNWQKERESSFLKWMLPVILTDEMTSGPDGIDHISELTDNFTNVELTILVNGVEMDASRFVDGVSRNMRHYANQEAQKILNDVPQFDALREVLETVERTAVQQIKDELRAKGVEIPEDDDW